MNKKTKHELSNGLSLFLNFFGNFFSILIFAVTVFGIYYFSKEAFELGKDYSTGSVGIDREFVLVVDEETSINKVSKILDDNEIILSKWLIIIENTLLGDKNYVVPTGEYTLNANMTANEIMKILYNNKSDLAREITITFTEGMTLKDIANHLEENDVLEAEDFINVAENHTFDFAFLSEIPQRKNHLEGYLFPDTYRIYAKSTPEQIINKMLSRFEDVYYSGYSTLANEKGYSIDEVITMASIIESEVYYDGEREKVASVIRNRLNSDMQLQMCSTVQYALDKRRDVITYEDLEVDSPYNTYLYGGLPLGPISNPGEASIRAVLQPAETDYLYFVLMDESTGEHFFTSSYEEFLSAKEKYGQIY